MDDLENTEAKENDDGSIKSSEERQKEKVSDIIYQCGVCSTAKTKEQGIAFCRTCRQYVCDKCFHYHRKESTLKHYDPIEGATTLVTCAVPCETHNDHVVCFLCRTHNSVFCRQCFRPHHKDCRVDYIPDVSNEFAEGKEFDDTIKRLELYVNTCDQFCAKVVKQIEEIVDANANVLREIDEFKKNQEERGDDFQEWKKELLEDVATIRRSNTQHITEIFDSCVALKEEITDFKIRMEQIKSLKEYDQLLIEIYGAQPKFEKWDKIFRTYYNKCRVLQIKFITSSFTSADKSFGKIQELPIPKPGDGKIQLEFTKTIIVKTNGDEQSCMVTAISKLSNERLLIADWNNKAVKTVNIVACVVEDSLQLSSVPWELVVLPGPKAAVTLPDEERIQILTTDKKLAKLESIKVAGKCCGVAYGRGKLVVTFREPGKCQILSMKGRVIWTSKLELGLSDHVHHVAVSKSGDSILVSDFDFDNVKKLDWIGKELARYVGGKIEWASGIVPLQDGAFFLCSKGNRTIHHVTKDCERIQVFGEAEEQLRNYNAVCFNENTSMLYASIASLTDKSADNAIRVFKVVIVKK